MLIVWRTRLEEGESPRALRACRAPNKSKGIGKHGLKLGIKRSEKKVSAATKNAAKAEVLLASEPGLLEAETDMERTARFSQRAIAQAVDLQTQRKAYNMKLDRFGPYRASYTPNGRVPRAVAVPFGHSSRTFMLSDIDAAPRATR